MTTPEQETNSSMLLAAHISCNGAYFLNKPGSTTKWLCQNSNRRTMHHHLTNPYIPVAFAPPKNPRAECKNIKLFRLLSTLQGEGRQDMHVMASEPNSYQICIDMGAPACLSNDTSHFISLNPIPQMTINGIGSGLEVKGVGMIQWLVLDDKGNEIELTVKNALLVLDTSICLLCPQQITQQTNKTGDGFHALGQHGILTFDGYRWMIHYHHQNWLLIVHSVCSHNSERTDSLNNCWSGDGWFPNWQPHTGPMNAVEIALSPSPHELRTHSATSMWWQASQVHSKL